MRVRLKFGEAFSKGGRAGFSSETFYNGYKNLIQMPNKLECF